MANQIAFEPLIGHLLLTPIVRLTRGCAALRTLCVAGITANRGRLANSGCWTGRPCCGS
ncbi:hypothetical protein ACFY4I_10885 [Streptomyces scabiei]|uniref:hypothetical protein n=1 Tax=Streptomyces scabiei TaxID=1930 RepID=UPI00369B8D2D